MMRGPAQEIPRAPLNDEILSAQHDAVLDDTPAWAGVHSHWQTHPNNRGVEQPQHTEDELYFGLRGIPMRIGWTFNAHLDPTTFFGSIMGETQFGIPNGGTETLILKRPVIYYRGAGKATIVQALPQSIQHGVNPAIPTLTVPRGLYG